MSNVDFDNFSEDYEEILFKNLSFFSRDINYFAEYKIDLIAKTIGFKPKNILEYGCGIGRNIPYLKKEFPESNIYGYDPSFKSLSYALKKYNYLNNLDKAQIDKYLNFFDLIICSGVYHHIKKNEREKTTREIFELAKNEGLFYVFEHNPYNLVTRRLVERCIYDKGVELMTLKDAKKLILASGFKYIESLYYLYFPQNLKLRKLEKFLYHFPFGGQYMLKAAKI